jgi:hypothetical protein
LFNLLSYLFYFYIFINLFIYLFTNSEKDYYYGWIASTLFWLLHSFQKNAKLKQRLQSEFQSLGEYTTAAHNETRDEDDAAKERSVTELEHAREVYAENERRLQLIAVTFRKLQREVMEFVRLVLEACLSLYHVFLRDRKSSLGPTLAPFASETLYARVGFVHAWLGVIVESSVLLSS